MGAASFDPLVDALRERGIPATVVPMAAYDWLPVVGGRSVRPILERIDHAVRHAAATGLCASDVEGGGTAPRLVVPRPRLSLGDRYADFQKTPGGVLKVGGATDPSAFPTIEPSGTFPPPSAAPQGRVALIGHSAAGWISRLYLSSRDYGGRAYRGAELVHSLVTLGSPHGASEGAAFENVAWLRQVEDPDEDLARRVRMLAVGGTGYLGSEWGTFTRNSYAFCVPGGAEEAELLSGDGVTPLRSALDLPGAETLVIEDVSHAPGYPSVAAPELSRDYEERRRWYGSPDALDQWLGWLTKESRDA